MKRMICLLIALCGFSQVAIAQNPDILWQKTLANDSHPISSIAIAEGKYVAALKGNEIIILDYATGDSVTAFAAPRYIIGDLILGKNGTRVYALNGDKPPGVGPVARLLQSWDIETKEQFTDTLYLPCLYQVVTPQGGPLYNLYNSLNGEYIVVSCYYDFVDLSRGGPETNGYSVAFLLYKTSSGGKIGLSSIHKLPNESQFTDISYSKNGEKPLFSGNYSSSLFSPSGNYFQYSYRFYSSQYINGSNGSYTTYDNHYGNIKSLTDSLPSYSYKYELPTCIISSDDDFLLDGALLKDIQRLHTYRKINKPGFVFLPDDNHMLAFKAGGGMAAISNIEKDTWEKVYTGDSLTENFIQTNASRSAFATASMYRITLWKVPDNLQNAELTADFTVLKDTIFIGDTVFYSNSTFPFKRGTQYQWDMGDGSNSTQVNPYHRYTKVGNYTITLNVTDTLGRTSTISKQVVVQGFRLPAGAVWTNRAIGNRVNCISYSPSGEIIASGSDSLAGTWISTTGKLLKTIQYTTKVISTKFMGKEDSIIVGSLSYKRSSMYGPFCNDEFNNYISIWSLDNNKSADSFVWPVFGGYNSPPYLVIHSAAACSDLSSDYNYYLSGHRVIADWSTTTPGMVGRDFNNYLRSNAVIGNYMYYNFKTNKSSFKSVFSFYTPMYDVKVAPNSRHYASILETTPNSPTLFLKDIATDSILRQIPTTATSMRFSPDKYHLLTSAGLWDVYDSILVKPVTLPQVFEYHPDGIHVFTIRADSSIGIYNLNSTTYEYIYPKQPTTFTCIAVAPDGKHFATGDAKGYITVWNVPDTLKSTVKADFTTLMTKRSSVKTTDTVGFFNTTLPASDNSIYYFWNFGDGTTSNEQSPKHRFMNPGKYTVTLTAFQYGKIMDTAIKAQYITVTGLATEEAQTEIHDNSIRIYPTPSYDETHIHLSLAQAGEYSLIITDNLGREVVQWTGNHSAGEETIIWNSVVPSGVYYALFSVGGVVRSVPIVVVK